MDLQLTGRRAMATASTAGIGAAVARFLSTEGCAVLLHGRDHERADALARELEAAGAEVEIVLGDLTDQNAAEQVADRAAFWGVEILVNNAGPFVEHDWNDADPAAWEASVQGNAITAVRMIRALVPGMRDAGWGRVINVGSRAATTPLTTWSPTPPPRRQCST